MASSKIVVVDYGMGNLLSVRRGLETCGASVEVTSDPNEIASAKKLVLPGVGAFQDGMRGLTERGLVDPIHRAIASGAKLMGICLGMQMLMENSTEHGFCEGLGLIPGSVDAIPSHNDHSLIRKIPHIGWTALSTNRAGVEWKQSLLMNTSPGDFMYFVHSFTALPNNVHTLATCDYLGYQVTAAVQKDNVCGFQFHPEKSGTAGLAILKTFVAQGG